VAAFADSCCRLAGKTKFGAGAGCVPTAFAAAAKFFERKI
jgi:hypothetical protein